MKEPICYGLNGKVENVTVLLILYSYFIHTLNYVLSHQLINMKIHELQYFSLREMVFVFCTTIL